MKRAITSIAAAAMVLGTTIPMAFAATTTTPAYTKVGTVAFSYNGSVVTNPYILDSQDSGNTTAFAPVFYFDQLLSKAGITASWNGSTKTWALTSSSLTSAQVAAVAAAIPGGVGTGNTTITLNGTTIKMINTFAAQDPAGVKGDITTYFPAYYVNEIFTAAGFGATWNGTTGLAVTTNASVAPTLSAITLSGQSMGTGTSAAPAVSTNNSNVTASTTLTDANGNPVAGIDVTFNVWGSDTAPTVTANGIDVSNTGSNDGTSTDPYQYIAATNASGVASISLAGSGNVAYTIQAVAPYSNNGITVTSSKTYVDFGQPGSLVLSPMTTQYAYSTSTSAAGVVPVTATVIPTVAGASAANVPVEFTISSASNVFESNATGSYLQPITAGTPITVNTGANGQAVLYVNATEAANLTVSASSNGLTSSSDSTLTWQASGVAYQLANTPTSAIAANANTNVTISGTVQDSLGNPVPNTQVLVSGYDSTNSGDFSYVNGTTTTAFPYVGTSLTGADASSSFGQVVTTDANGNFSVTVNDTDAANQNAFVQVWGIQNGQVSSELTTGNGYEINLSTNDTTLSNLYVDSSLAGLGATAANDEYSSLTGLSYEDTGSATANPVYVGAFAGTAPYTAGNGTVSYTVTANNKGVIAAIDGVALGGTGGLPNNPSSAVVNVTYTSGDVTGVTVDGTSISLSQNPGDTAAFTFVPGDTTVENDTYTITTGAEKATVGANFISGGASYANAFSPVASQIAPGQTEQVTYTVVDSEGNPVANSLTTIESADANNPLWITNVNGVTLQQTETVGSTSATEPTPIPLGSANAAGYGVNLAGVVAYNNGNKNISVYTDAKGQVTLTLEGAGTSYWNTNAVDTFTSTAGATETVYSTSAAGTNPWQLYIGNTADTETDATQLGTITVGSSTTQSGVAHMTGLTYGTETGTAAAGGSFAVATAATGTDAYDNSVSATGGTYTITGPVGATGVTISSSTGAVTLAAGATTGSYTVTYTVGTVTTTATITVA